MIAHAFGRARGAADPVPRRLSPEQAASARPEQFEFLWLDLFEPDASDLARLVGGFGFHPLAVEDVARRHQRPKIDQYRDYYFLVLYALVPEAGGLAAAPNTAEVQLFWGQTYLVTVRSDPCAEVDDLAHRLDGGEVRPVIAQAAHAGQAALPLGIPDIAYRLLDSIVDGYFPYVDAVAERSEDVEEEMFAAGAGRDTLEQIFRMKKRLIHLRKLVAPSRDVVNVLLRHDVGLFGAEYTPYFQDVYDHTVRVIDALDTYRDSLSTTVDVYLSLTSNNVNQTVKTMTAVTAIIMVQALVASIYGMNFEVMPELRWTYGYPWALGLMAALGGAMWAVFRWIKWL